MDFGLPPETDVNKFTPTAGVLKLQQIRPSVSAAIDLARARGKVASGTGLPDRMPGEPPLFVGSGAHAADLKVLDKLGITAVLNCAPTVCKDPLAAYTQRGISYQAVDAQDDRSFPLLDLCLPVATAFISAMHAEGRSVLVHCMAGVNRSAALTIAYLLMRDKRNLFTLFTECSAARPSILQNPSFQLQLCALAHRHGLLSEPARSRVRIRVRPASVDEVVVEEGADAGAATAAPDHEVRDPTAGALKAHVLSGNRQMAEDLDRCKCATCGRTFAPSVLTRHAPICANSAAKAAARRESARRAVEILGHRGRDASSVAPSRSDPTSDETPSVGHESPVSTRAERDLLVETIHRARQRRAQQQGLAPGRSNEGGADSATHPRMQGAGVRPAECAAVEASAALPHMHVSMHI